MRTLMSSGDVISGDKVKVVGSQRSHLGYGGNWIIASGYNLGCPGSFAHASPSSSGAAVAAGQFSTPCVSVRLHRVVCVLCVHAMRMC